MKKLTALFCALLLGMPATMPAKAVQTQGKLNNIVLFAQFQPLADGNFMADQTDFIRNLCNDKSSLHSLTGYVDAISYGQLDVESYFPQMQDGVIVPYVLQQPESAYDNCMQYALEMVQNIPVPADIPLDGNRDGIVDNIILVVDGKAEEMNSPLWAKAFSGAGLTLNGLNVDRMNIQNSKQLLTDILTGQEGVLCHEFLHSLGYPDLYRHGRTGNPVGMWDIMASDSVFLQYPLAYQRMAVSGWLDAETITESGTYTLTCAAKDSGNRLYLLKTPLSDTEFFAVEYRKQGAKYSKELDVKIYGSGLVVYRVNTEADGNFKEERDQIYVFRPEETALDAGEGNLTLSCYGGTGAPDSVGSTDFSAGIADGALVYSNGTNSGIALTDITMDGDTLTFQATFADRGDVQLWESIPTAALAGMLPYQLAASPDGKPVLLAAGNGKAGLYQVDDKGLTPIGSSLGSGKPTDMNAPKLAYCNGLAYVLYHDPQFLLHLCVQKESGWQEVWKGNALAQYAALTSDGRQLHLAYTTGSFPYALQAACYDAATGTLTQTGQDIAANACNLSMAMVGGKPAIAYRDIRDDNRPKLAVMDGDTWQTEPLSDNPCGGVQIATTGDTALIAPSGKGNGVYRYESGSCIAYPLPTEVADTAFQQLPIPAGGDIYVAVNGQNPDVLAVYRLTDKGWTMLGDTLAKEVVNEPGFLACGDKLYGAFSTNTGTAVVKCLTIGSKGEGIKGDVNADGQCSIADALALQKWLLGDGTLADWQAGDLNGDNKLTAVDLSLLKRMLL